MAASHVSTGTKARPGPSQPAGGKVRVLLADDNPAVLQHVSELLADDFDVVATLPDGEEVVLKYIELKPDLLILDISMQKVSGLEAARSLRQQEFNPYIIFLTVHEEPDFVQAAMAWGASGYVVKSHLISDLIPAIEAALAGNLFISPCLRHKPPAE